MRRKVSLYIADRLVDLDDQSFILFAHPVGGIFADTAEFFENILQGYHRKRIISFLGIESDATFDWNVQHAKIAYIAAMTAG